jgi:hypothetical protein
MDYKRINERIRDYWQSLAGSNAMPAEKDVNPDDLEDIWAHCFLVQVLEGGKYRYVYLGDDLIEAYGDDVTGYEAAETIIGQAESPFMEEFAELLDKQRPIESDSSFVNPQNVEIRYRLCIVPLSGPRGEISHILGGLKWKAF